MLGSFSTIFLLATVTLAASLPLKELTASYKHSPKYLSLTRRRASTQSNSQWRCPRGSDVGEAELYSNYDASFFTNMTIGGQEMLLIIDTGSSDTWIVDSTFTCVNITTYETIPQETCALVAAYTPGDTFEEIPDQNFNITYGDLSFLNGFFGYDTVELAGIEVSRQQIAVADLAGFRGDNVTSGLVGLSYPGLTSAYAGTNVSADNVTDPASRIPYSSIINTIFFIENLTEPLFSISLSRNPIDPTLLGFGGYLTIGGIPDISDLAINASSTFAVTAIEPYRSSRIDPVNIRSYFITVEDVVYPFSSNLNDTQMLVDCGTTLNYFPTEAADAINALFDPPAIYDENYGAYIVPCNATPPSEVGVTIAGQTFYHNPADLIFLDDSELGICISGINDAGVAGITGILGGTFMKNVVAVFDVGKTEIGFASRPYYEVEGSD